MCPGGSAGAGDTNHRPKYPVGKCILMRPTMWHAQVRPCGQMTRDGAVEDNT